MYLVVCQYELLFFFLNILIHWRNLPKIKTDIVRNIYFFAIPKLIVSVHNCFLKRGNPVELSYHCEYFIVLFKKARYFHF